MMHPAPIVRLLRRVQAPARQDPFARLTERLRTLPLFGLVLFAGLACSKSSEPSSGAGAPVQSSSPAAPSPGQPEAAAPAPEIETSWTDFRGPGRASISPETGLLREWPTSGPPLLWTADGLGRGYGSITLDDERVFLQGTADGRSCVFALARSDGSLRWRTPIADIYASDRGVGPNSTPVVDADSVYALSENGTLVRLHAADGTLAWSLDFTETFGSTMPHYGYSESPLVRDGVVYVMPGGKEGAVVALNASDGTLRWRSRELTDAASYCSLVPATIDGVGVLLGYSAASAFGLSARDGRLFFQTAESANHTANAAMPLVAPPHVFYSSSYSTGGGLLMTLYRAGDRLLGEKVYFTPKMKNHFGGLVYQDGHVYGCNGHILQCMRLSDGRILWAERGPGLSAVLLAEGLLYVYNDSSEIALVEARPDAFRLRSRMKLEARGAPSLAAPAILDRRLYLRDTDRLYCFNIAG